MVRMTPRRKSVRSWVIVLAAFALSGTAAAPKAVSLPAAAITETTPKIVSGKSTQVTMLRSASSSHSSDKRIPLAHTVSLRDAAPLIRKSGRIVGLRADNGGLIGGIMAPPNKQLSDVDALDLETYFVQHRERNRC